MCGNDFIVAYGLKRGLCGVTGQVVFVWLKDIFGQFILDFFKKFISFAWKFLCGLSWPHRS